MKMKMYCQLKKSLTSKIKYAVTGLYVFDKNAPEIAKTLKPSARGELEIVDMLNYYLNHNRLKVNLLGRGVSWLDIGTHNSLHEASKYIEVLENRQGLKIACLEEIAFDKKFITKDELLTLAEPFKKPIWAIFIPNCRYKNMTDIIPFAFL